MTNVSNDQEWAGDVAQYENLRNELNTELAQELQAGSELAPEPVPQRHEPHYGADEPAPAQQQQHYEQSQQPNIYEDPIGHFNSRASAVEQHLQQRQFMDVVDASEKKMREEVGSDYDQACSHLEGHRRSELARMLPDNSREAHIRARQHGFQHPAHLREAILNRDRVAVATQALQSGMSPAQLYYELAQQRGYKPSAPIGRSAMRELTQLATDNPALFDKAWDKLARMGRL